MLALVSASRTFHCFQVRHLPSPRQSSIPDISFQTSYDRVGTLQQQPVGRILDQSFNDFPPFAQDVRRDSGRLISDHFMKYRRVCFETLAHTLPAQVLTTDHLESLLLPVYERLRLPAGRLELMTGINARRVWDENRLPSTVSIETANKAINAAGIGRHNIGALVHASVCRDHLEPATACAVHHGLDLPRECMIYDVSNACLGLLNGVVQVANMIELGQIRAGVVVGTESSRALLETTIQKLNSDTSLTRSDMKLAVASLTIGSASAAIVLTDRELSNTGNELLSARGQAFTSHHRLCHSGADEALANGMHPLMTTDSQQLLAEGIAAGEQTFDEILSELEWDVSSIDKTFCHQVGVAHQRLMYSQLGLDTAKDFSTFDFLGNTGSVALPTTLSLGIQQNRLSAGDQVALLGIGSGINVLMLALRWQKSLLSADVDGGDETYPAKMRIDPVHTTSNHSPHIPTVISSIQPSSVQSPRMARATMSRSK